MKKQNRIEITLSVSLATTSDNPDEIDSAARLIANGNEQEKLMEIASWMDALAVSLAKKAKYISVRFGLNGTGEHSQKDAVKEMNKTRKKVRRALGYSYP